MGNTTESDLDNNSIFGGKIETILDGSLDEVKTTKRIK
jgi:hypothetical protein